MTRFNTLGCGGIAMLLLLALIVFWVAGW